MHKASKMQLRAIQHVKGPARVIAGPGSGKTFTIVQRLLELIIQNHINPGNILTITFTKAAALEMQGRYRKETENHPTLENTGEHVHFGTFHGVGYAILKESGLIKNFSLIKESEKRKIMEILLQNRGIEGACEYDNISISLNAIGRRKNFMETNPPLNLTKEAFDDIYLEYEDMLNQQKLLDFDDMILMSLKQLRSNAFLCRKWQERFEYILVDEFQDINEVQYRLIRLLASPQDNLFVVGDDDQSIYGFRGSAPGIMRKFLEDYKGAAELSLSENYRSGARIIELADQVISKNTDRLKKIPVPMREGGKVNICYQETRKEEEEQLCRDIQKLSAEQLHDSAIIVRTNMEAVQYASLLKQHGIAVKEKKKQETVLQHFIAQDFQAFLRFVYEGNKRGDFIKIMNKPNLFLSRKALIENVITEKSLLTYYRNNSEMKQKIEALFRHFYMASGLSPHLSVRYFRKVMGYDEYLKQKARQEMMDNFLKTADEIQKMLEKMKKGESADAFFERAEQEWAGQKQKESNPVTPSVSVITMHGAKGLEFHSVFLPDLNEGVIPGRNSKTPESLEEERRLLYVAITRAKNSLYLYYTRERNRKLTRYLAGIIPDQCP